MDTDNVRVGPDAPLENFVVRTVKARTNPHQRGARLTDLYRTLPGRFQPGTAQGQEDVAESLAVLVEDGVLETVDHDGTIYYRLVAEG